MSGYFSFDWQSILLEVNRLFLQALTSKRMEIADIKS